jgi:hypothetical protein
MSATSGKNLKVVHSYADARHRKLWRILNSYGVLTHDALRELAHPDGWDMSFEVVLARAVAAGRVRRLSADLYEAGTDPLQPRPAGDDPPAAA